MLLATLREIVWKCNLELPKNGLVKMTNGNVSGRDSETGLVVIKPSGYSYEEMTPAHMVVVDLEGHILEGDFKPSTDTETHLYVYRHRPDVFGIVHTHSPYASSFALLGQPIPACTDGFGHAGRRGAPGRATRRWGGRHRPGDCRQNRPFAGHRHAKSRRLYHRLLAAASYQDGGRSRGNRQNHAPGDAARAAHFAHAEPNRTDGEICIKMSTANAAAWTRMSRRML